MFETLRTYSGRPFLLERHVDRLRTGAATIGLSSIPTEGALLRACFAALEEGRGALGSDDRVLRVALYSADGRATLAVQVEPLPGPAGGTAPRRLVAGVSPYPHPGAYLVPPGAPAPVKWLARGPLAHALRLARGEGWEEAILASKDGHLVEGTRSNLIAVLDGRLVAPGAESFALSGITREVVLDDARRLGLEVEQRALRPEELRRASELLLTSSLLGVAQVDRLAGRPSWRARAPGPVAAALERAHRRRTGGTGKGRPEGPRNRGSASDARRPADART